MFQCKIDKIFKDLPNVFGIVGDILAGRYDSDGKDVMKPYGGYFKFAGCKFKT